MFTHKLLSGIPWSEKCVNVDISVPEVREEMASLPAIQRT